MKIGPFKFVVDSAKTATMPRFGLFDDETSPNEPYTPESLLCQCFKFVVRNLDSVFTEDAKGYELEPGQALPREICESLIRHYQLCGYMVNDKFIRLFKDKSSTALRYVRLRNSSITDDGLKTILSHRLVELDIAKCPIITDQSLNALNEYSDRLVSLTVGHGVQLLPDSLVYTLALGPWPDPRGYILRFV